MIKAPLFLISKQLLIVYEVSRSRSSEAMRKRTGKSKERSTVRRGKAMQCGNEVRTVGAALRLDGDFRLGHMMHTTIPVTPASLNILPDIL